MTNTTEKIRRLMHTYLNMQDNLTEEIEEAKRDNDVNAHICGKSMKVQCRTMIKELWEVMIQVGALDEEEIEMGGIRGASYIEGKRIVQLPQLQEDFQRLDDSLKDLGKSDSAIEHAPHVRNYMNVVFDRLNKIKSKLGLECKSSDSYFE